MRIIVIGDRDTVTGFRLAGVEGRHVNTIEEADSAMDEALRAPDTGVILITKQWAAKMRERIESSHKKLMPVIMEIPDRHGPINDNDEDLSCKVRRILGI
ncbi:MAG: V-type ATP synthase subunit F [Firmicutes bacterium]|nr:V-type ATP synthase subunit F [Bacillota bacterium]